MLTKKELITTQQSKPLQNYIAFFGVRNKSIDNPNEDCLSNFFIASFKVDTHTYICVEQYMMAGKALLFKDEIKFKEIMSETNPANMKRLGKQVTGFDPAVWKRNKIRIVREGVLAKFSQHIALKNYLLSTGTNVLIEAAPYDAIWGVGCEAHNPNLIYPEKWPGSNLLGFILMDVRDEIASKE